MVSTRQGKLLVRGSVNIDEFFVVPHIVRSGETISSQGFTKRGGGKGANQAVSASKAGADVTLAGAIGSDGQWLKKQLADFGVNTEHLLEDSELPTGRALIQLSQATRDNSIVLLKGANFSLSPALASLPLSGYSHILLQNEIPLASTLSFMTEGSKAGLQTIFNPSPMLTAEEWQSFPWSSLHWLLVNEGEASELLSILSPSSSTPADSEGVLAAVRRLPQLAGLSGILMTRGGDGVSAALGGAEGETVSVGAGEVVGKVVDTTGAGDCFTGYFATLISLLPTPTPSAEQLRSILNIASQAGAMCVEKEGAMESVPLFADVKARIEDSGKWPAGF